MPNTREPERLIRHRRFLIRTRLAAGRCEIRDLDPRLLRRDGPACWVGRSTRCQPRPAIPDQLYQPEIFLQTPMDPPIGYTGPSGVLPTEAQQSSHFVPVEDRWRIGYPDRDRYGKGHPILDDYPYLSGRWFDPYNQNVFKGDYPIIGQHTFLEVTAQANLDFEGRQIPPRPRRLRAPSGLVRETFLATRTASSRSTIFLSRSTCFMAPAFKPVDWRIKLVPTLGVSNFSFSELAQTSPNVLQGTTRTREVWALKKAFAEYKLADFGPDYDFVVDTGRNPAVQR